MLGLNQFSCNIIWIKWIFIYFHHIRMVTKRILNSLVTSGTTSKINSIFHLFLFLLRGNYCIVHSSGVLLFMELDVRSCNSRHNVWGPNKSKSQKLIQPIMHYMYIYNTSKKDDIWLYRKSNMYWEHFCPVCASSLRWKVASSCVSSKVKMMVSITCSAVTKHTRWWRLRFQGPSRMSILQSLWQSA